MAGRSILGDLAGLFRQAAPRNEAPVDVSGSGGLSGLIRSGLAVTANATGQLDAMETSSMVFTVVNTIAEGVGAVEFGLFRKPPGGRVRFGQVQSDRIEVAKHPALTVWEHPNDFYTESEFVEASVQHYELTGEWCWVVGRHESSTMPLELWPIRPDRLVPIKHPTKFMVGWMYVGGGERIPLDLDQVIHTRRPNPKDPYRGLSPLAAALVDVYGEEAAAAWNMMFFRNGASPGGVIEFAEALGDTEWRRFRKRWNEQHRGVNNAHRVAMIERGKWIDLKYTRKDMEFLDGRRFSQEMIRRAWRMPKPMLGDSDDVNRANAEAAAVTFAQWLVVPRARKLRDCLNTQLLPLFGPALSTSVEFDFADPTPPDREADRDDQTAAVARAKVLIVDIGADPGEVFEHEGLPAFTVTKPEPPALGPGPAKEDPERETDTEEEGEEEDETEAKASALADLLRGELAPLELLDYQQWTRDHLVGHGCPDHPGGCAGRHLAGIVNVGGDADLDDEPSRVEQTMAELQDAWQVGLDVLMVDWPAIKSGLVDQIMVQAERVLEAKGLGGLADITVDTSALAARLHVAMIEQARLSTVGVITEAAEAGVRINTTGPDPDQLRRAADALAEILGSRVLGTAKGAALRSWSTDNEASWPGLPV